MQLITNAALLLAVSATAMASTTHHGHKQPQQLMPQGHYRHLGRANTTGVNPTLGMPDVSLPLRRIYRTSLESID
jgi:hypothetical protein